jgi:hypothetical protein
MRTSRDASHTSADRRLFLKKRLAAGVADAGLALLGDRPHALAQRLAGLKDKGALAKELQTRSALETLSAPSVHLSRLKDRANRLAAFLVISTTSRAWSDARRLA